MEKKSDDPERQIGVDGSLGSLRNLDILRNLKIFKGEGRCIS